MSCLQPAGLIKDILPEKALKTQELDFNSKDELENLLKDIGFEDLSEAEITKFYKHLEQNKELLQC